MLCFVYADYVMTAVVQHWIRVWHVKISIVLSKFYCLKVMEVLCLSWRSGELSKANSMTEGSIVD